jgi:restriction system protein
MASDDQEHSLAEARDSLAEEFRLSNADREEPLPSGRQSKFSNRVAWAKSYLQQAGLLLSPRRGHFKVSVRGSDVLKAPPARIDIKFLEQYPEFVEFRTPKTEAEKLPSAVATTQPEPETPEEALEVAHLKMRMGLASELLSRIKAVSPQFFGVWWSSYS